MEFLYRVSDLVSSGLSFDDMLKELVRLAIEATRGDACLLYVAEPGSGEMVLRASHPSESGAPVLAGSLDEQTWEAMLSVPLVTGGEAVGVLHVHHKAPHAHSRDEVAWLTFLGAQIAIVIARMRVAEEVARARRELDARKAMERAKGILQQKHSLTEEQAYFRLRNLSRKLRRPMRELAEAIIVAETLAREVDPGV